MARLTAYPSARRLAYYLVEPASQVRLAHKAAFHGDLAQGIIRFEQEMLSTILIAGSPRPIYSAIS